LDEKRGYWTTANRARFNRRRLLQGTAAGTIGLAGLGLVGCGDDDDDDDDISAPSTPGGAQTPAASPSAAVGQPIKGGRMYNQLSGNGSAPATFDPYVNSSGPGQAFWGYMTNRILREITGDASKGPDDRRFEPDVASAVPEQPDAQTVVIKVRDNVTFQDIAPVNGRKMTARDVAYSIQRYKDIGQQKTQLGAIETIDVPDDTTVTLKLNTPTVSLIAVLQDPRTVWIMAEEVSQEEIGPDGPFIGTGPFIFEKYDVDVQFFFKSNPDYWETGLPHIDGIDAPLIPQRVTQLANFRSGRLDTQNVVDKAEYEDLRKGEGVHEQILKGSGYNKNDLAMHVPPFNNRLVRQAMSMATNRDEMAAANDVIDYQWANHAYPNGWGEYSLDPRNEAEFGENAKYFKYDPAEAKKMLSAAGYADGFDTKLIFTPYYAGHQVNAELIVDQYAKVGVNVALETYTYTEYQEKYKNSKPISERLWEGMFANAPSSYADPSLTFRTYWLPSATRTVVMFEDPWLEEQFAKQDQELDTEKRYEILREMQRHMAFEMNGVPWITQNNADLWQDRLKNYKLKSTNGRPVTTYARLWLDENS
jgi:peptide/nickel transport system substrate-binding protein